ncbi:MAG: GSCFA domain-containing protein [Maritimibacter sp.]|nr:GSCFA domain-containing protein [Maritimibacter sp.]
MPYSDLPPQAFWKLCRTDPEFLTTAIYRPKFPLAPGMRVATAGSCFAQNVGRYIRASELDFVDAEPAPPGMGQDTQTRFGYGLYSARYGNVYTARQLRQLVEDAWSGTVHDAAVWSNGGRYYDGLRPNVEPGGLASAGEVRAQRRDHLRRVRRMFAQTDVFIFTLGLTEAWADRESGLVFPTAPGVVAGRFDPARHHFVNFGMAETFEDLAAALAILRAARPGLRVILTVSPVPLTATASGDHVLVATTYSKSVLRAVAGELAALDPATDYFPSYEIIAGLPFGTRHYQDNLRNVTRAGVDAAMGVFFAAHSGLRPVPHPVPLKVCDCAPSDVATEEQTEVCEEAMLAAFDAA